VHEKDERGKHYRGVQLGATELKKDGEHFGRWREGKEGRGFEANLFG